VDIHHSIIEQAGSDMSANRTPSTTKAESSSSSAAPLEVKADDDRWEARRWALCFLRLWIASAVIWVAVVGLVALNDWHSQKPLEWAAWAFIPPICALAVVLMLVWIRPGFRVRS